MTIFFKKRIITLLSILYLTFLPINAQNKITPTIPETNINIINQEAEDAIVTNFTTGIILNNTNSSTIINTNISFASQSCLSLQNSSNNTITKGWMYNCTDYSVLLNASSNFNVERLGAAFGNFSLGIPIT